MPRDVVTLFAQDDGKKLIARHCRNIKLPVADLRDLVETVVEMNSMVRRRGLTDAFDDVLGRTDGTEE